MHDSVQIILSDVRDVKFRIAGLTEEQLGEFESFKFCPACGSDREPETVLRVGGQERRQMVTLVLCGGCSHTYYRNPPSDRQLRMFYESDFAIRLNRPRRHRRGKPSIRSKAVAMLRDLGVSASSNAKILDFGCGYGGELVALQEAGFKELVGFEPGADRSARASAVTSATILQGSWREVPKEMKFDVIFSNHVFEHLRDPALVFDGLTRHLEPDGFFIVNVPNSERESPIPKALYLPHLHSFSRLSLSALGARFGYRCLYWSGNRHDELCAVFNGETSRLDALVDEGLLSAAPAINENELVARLIQEARAPWLSDSRSGHLQWQRLLDADQEPRDAWQRISGLQAFGLRVLNLLEQAILMTGVMHFYFFISRGLKILSGRKKNIRTTSHLSLERRENKGDRVVDLCGRAAEVPLLIK